MCREVMVDGGGRGEDGEGEDGGWMGRICIELA